MVLLVPPTVTATFAPLPLPQALERLSTGTGERWACAPALKDEVLFARLTDAPAERVRRVVGEVLDAEWVSDGSTLRLMPDPEAIRRRTQRNEAARIGRIAEGRERLRVELDKLPPHFTAADAQTYASHTEESRKRFVAWTKGNANGLPPDLGSEERTPSWRAAVAVTLTLPLRDLETLKPGERVVYADRPTSRQRPLPSAATPALAQYRQESLPYVEGKTPFRVRLVLTRKSGDEGEIDAEFQSVDAQGEGIESESVELNPLPELPQPEGKGRRVRLDPDVVEHAALLADDEDAGMVRDARFAAWSARLQDPVQEEPLKWGVGAAVLACAAAAGESTIGTANDDMTTPGPDVEGSVLPSNYLDRLAPLWRRENGWLVFDPPRRFPRVPRVAARDFIRQAVRAGGLTLDRAAAWVSSLSPEADDWAIETIQILTSTPVPGEPDDLRFWAALGPDARAALLAGHTLPLFLVPLAAQKIAGSRLYGSNPLASDDGEIEPTERFAEGPPDPNLSLEAKEAPAALAWNATVGEPVVRQLSSAAFMGRRLGRSDALGKTVEPDRFRVTEDRGLVLMLAYAPDVRLTCLFDEALLPPDGPVLTALPDDLAKEFEAGRARGRAAAGSNPKP